MHAAGGLGIDQHRCIQCFKGRKLRLDAPVDILAERTSRRDTRAQLRNGDPKAVLERLSMERRPSYAEAHIHVKSGDGAHKDVVESIVAALDNYLDKLPGT